MKKIYWLLMSFLACIFLFSCVTTQTKTETVGIDFAKALAVSAIDGDSEEWKQINTQIALMDPIDLAVLKKLLLDVLKQDPPVTTSIAGTWLVYRIIYMIDDMLGTLEYTTVVEGKFIWDRAATLFGTTDLDFLTDSGDQIAIFTTVATVDKESAYLNSEGRRVRLYIKEEIFNKGLKRNHVLKIETLY